MSEEESEERIHPYPEPDTSLLKNKISCTEPGTTVAASESFQSSHLSIKAPFVGVGVRTSLSPMLPPPLRA
ncbi:hypothetical protein PAMA_009372 [Pampus argenteus]